MQICYCEDCGLRIPPKDLEDGSAHQVAENQFRCPACNKKKAGAPSTPAAAASGGAAGSGIRRAPNVAAGTSANAVRTATPISGSRHIEMPPHRRATTTENSKATKTIRRTEEKKLSALPLAVGGGLVVGIVVLAVMNSGGKPDSAAPSKDASSQVSVAKSSEKTTTSEPVKANPTPSKLPETQPVAATRTEPSSKDEAATKAEPVKSNTAPGNLPETQPVAATKTGPSAKEEPAAKAEPVSGTLTKQAEMEDFREGYAKRQWADLKREAESPEAGLSVAVRVRGFAATYSNTAAGKEAAELIQTSPLFKEPAATSLLAHFSRDFKPESPAPGWAYLVNPNGPIGNAANYKPLVWNNTGRYSGNDKTFPAPPPHGGVSVASTGAHPGYAAGEFRRDPARIDRYAIVAYTLQPGQGGAIHFWGKVHRTAGENESVELLIYVNDVHKAQIISKELEHRGPLGNLKEGDTVYFALGPNKSSASDTTVIDYKLFKAE